MYYEETTRKPLGRFQLKCPVCDIETTCLLTKEERSGCLLIIPWWWISGYFLTCGSCFNTVKIDKKLGRELEDRLHKDELL